MSESTLMPKPPPLPEGRAGAIVWWSATVVQVDCNVLRAAMPTRLRGLVTNPKEARPALREAMARRQGAAMQKDWRWEVVADDKLGLKIALAQAQRDPAAADPFSARTRFTVTVVDSGMVTTSRPPQHGEETEALDALITRYHIERNNLTSGAIRNLLVKVITGHARGTAQREGGGVFFVPAPDDEVIDEITPAIALAGSHLIRFPVFKDGSAGQLAGATRDGLMADVEKLKLEAFERLAAVGDGKNTKAETLAKAIAHAEDIRAKARLYQHIVGLQMDDVLDALKEAETLVSETRKMMAARVAL